MLVPVSTEVLSVPFVNLGHGVFVGVAVLVELGVNEGDGVEVLVGDGVGGICPRDRPDGSKLQLMNCPLALTQPVVDSPCSLTSSQDPSPFLAKGSSTVPLLSVLIGGSYTTPGPLRRLRKLETTKQLAISVGVPVGTAAVSVAVGESSEGTGVLLGCAAAVSAPSTIIVEARPPPQYLQA